MRQRLFIQDIDYRPDPCGHFERLRDLPHPALLDSCADLGSGGRFDILCAAPDDGGLPPPPAVLGESACRGYFDSLRYFHEERFGHCSAAQYGLPFCGGLLGYLGYELGGGLHDIAAHTGTAPAAQLHAYHWAVVQDHRRRRAVVAALPSCPGHIRRDVLARLRGRGSAANAGFALDSPFTTRLSEDAYGAAFEAVRAYITAGDCYQVNLARLFCAPYHGDPWQAYRRLRGIARAPFSGYTDLAPQGAVLSLSPERFLALRGDQVETSPIKGTRPRGGDAAADRRQARELLASEKDRAENLMIVDLLRNDLGRNCRPGSIRADRLFELHSFATVHHLVSTLEGRLRPDATAFELLRDSFPGGSITGAPKRRAMQIIRELEPAARDIYCGSLVYIGADGNMDSNIAIRSLLCRDSTIRCWGGGGIVADSRCEAEYQETLDKVGRLIDALEAGSAYTGVSGA